MAAVHESFIKMNGDMEQVQLKRLNDLITKNPVLIFSKSQCSKCNTVKELFEKLKVKYLSVEFDMEEGGSEMQAVLADKISNKTLPQIFVGGDLIGDYLETLKSYDDGLLTEFLEGLNLISS